MENFHAEIFPRQDQTYLFPFDDHGHHNFKEIYSSVFYLCWKVSTIFHCFVWSDIQSNIECDFNPIVIWRWPTRLFLFFNSVELPIVAGILVICLNSFNRCFVSVNSTLSRFQCLVHWGIFFVDGKFVYFQGFIFSLSPLWMINLGELYSCRRVHLSDGLIAERSLFPNKSSTSFTSTKTSEDLYLVECISIINWIVLFSLKKHWEKLRRSFNGFVPFHGEYWQETNGMAYHLCSVTCRSESFGDISNRFPSGWFNCVRRGNVGGKNPLNTNSEKIPEMIVSFWSSMNMKEDSSSNREIDGNIEQAH